MTEKNKINGPGESALLLLEVINTLNNLKIPYAVIGAFAASFYGVVRASIDADAMISLKTNKQNIEKLLSKLKKDGLEVTQRHGDICDPIASVINIVDKFHNRVDLLMGIKGLGEDVFLRIHDSLFMGEKIQVIGIEDFIVMKIFAGSSKDINDVEGVFKISLKKINLTLLKNLATQYDQNVLNKLESLLKNISLNNE